VTANPWSNNHRWSTWARDAQRGDQLDNHLARNTPQSAGGGAYATTGTMQWRGPYVAGSTPLDPWGRPYVINVLSGWRTDATNYKRMWVMSAGPNGIFDTDYRARATDEISGDDIGEMFMQRQYSLPPAPLTCRDRKASRSTSTTRAPMRGIPLDALQVNSS